jgi:hypothetical protein
MEIEFEFEKLFGNTYNLKYEVYLEDDEERFKEEILEEFKLNIQEQYGEK